MVQLREYSPSDKNFCEKIGNDSIRMDEQAPYKYVLEDTQKGGVIGFVVAENDGAKMKIKGLAVKPGYQRKGYGSKLLNHLESVAMQQQCISTSLISSSEIDFYVHRGYRPKGKSINYLEKNLMFL